MLVAADRATRQSVLDAAVRAKANFGDAESIELTVALSILRPLNEATNMLQRDGATLLDTMAAFSKITAAYGQNLAGATAALKRHLEKAIAQTDSRFDWQFAKPAFLVVAFFHPGADRLADNITRQLLDAVGHVVARVDPDAEADFAVFREQPLPPALRAAL